MKGWNILIVIVLVSFFSCSSEREKSTEYDQAKPVSAMAFDKTKWRIKDGKDYPFRKKMLNDVVYNDTIRTLNKAQIIDLLGNPDRINENYLYYRIDQIRLIVWPLHTTTMVVKFTNDSTMEWIKIHK